MGTDYKMGRLEWMQYTVLFPKWMIVSWMWMAGGIYDAHDKA
jgi:hypothetical protein